ncbi:MAG: class I SAM-dependent methyltransferase [Pirellulaceae bacterium]
MKNPLISLARRFTRVLMRSDRLWELAQKLPGQAFFLQQRLPVIRKRAGRECAPLLDRLEVLSGPFAGLRYAESATVSCALWPMLMGTYESELRHCLDSIGKSNQYRRIVDVGFAEGFYLLGLGRMFQSADLVGFDLNEEAEGLCRANASINGIEEQRLKLHGGFDATTFRDELDDESLVVVDCEGFENDVIESLAPEDFQKADWLIETHDHLIEGTTQRMALAFEGTHDVVCLGTDDDESEKVALLPEFIRQQHNQYIQEALVAERRKAKQYWIFATRKAA